MGLEVTCNFRLYLKKGPASVTQSWKHWIFTNNYGCLHIGVPYNTGFGWNRPNIKAQCSLFIYSWQCVLLYYDIIFRKPLILSTFRNPKNINLSLSHTVGLMLVYNTGWLQYNLTWFASFLHVYYGYPPHPPTQTP